MADPSEPESEQAVQKPKSFFWMIVLFMGGLGGLVYSISWFGSQDKPAEMGIAVAAAVVVMAFSQLDRFSRFKAGVFEFQLREIQRIRQEAVATLDQLRGLAVTLSKVTLDQLAWTGLRGLNLSTFHRMEIAEEMLKVIRGLGATEHDVANVRRIFDVHIRARHGREIEQAAKVAAGSITVEKMEEVKTLESLINARALSVATARHYRSMLEKLELQNPELDELLRDYEHFEETGKLRRREFWEDA